MECRALAALFARLPPLAEPPKPPGAIALRFLTAAPGLATRSEGKSEVGAQPGVYDVTLSVSPGDCVNPMTEN